MALTWPVTSAQVRTFTDMSDPGSDGSLDQAVEAVNSYVPTLEQLATYWTTPEEPEEPEFEPPADVILGAVLLASRWHARRGTQLGTMGFAELGGVETILIQDPDIRRLLRMGPAGAFVFGAPSTPVEEEAS